MLTAIISIVLFVAYVAFAVMLMLGWRKLPVACPKSKDVAEKVTVLVPVHNAAGQVQNWAHQFDNQPDVLLLMVDDHSTDGTWEALQQLSAEIKNLTCLRSFLPQGKKQALRAGMEQASTRFVLATDVDARMPQNGLAVVDEWLQSTSCDLLLLPVCIEDSGFFARLQRIEMASLVGAGMAMAGWQKPIMCNGAGLVVNRSQWLLSVPDLHPELPSGDDMFLLHSFKRRDLKVVYAATPDLLVQVPAAVTLRDFLHQRMRWASKADSYTDAATLLVGAQVALVNAWLLILPILTLCGVPNALLCWIAFFAGKFVLDYAFLHQMRGLFPCKHLLLGSLLVALVYPVYAFVSVLGGLWRPKRW